MRRYPILGLLGVSTLFPDFDFVDTSPLSYVWGISKDGPASLCDPNQDCDATKCQFDQLGKVLWRGGDPGRVVREVERGERP